MWDGQENIEDALNRRVCGPKTFIARGYCSVDSRHRFSKKEWRYLFSFQMASILQFHKMFLCFSIHSSRDLSNENTYTSPVSIALE